ncbi:MAG: acetate/propionate family kinase [Sedimentisphaerales bacterium]|nr:acetate/propionate family kinase [Sedimentisphaerales bacterium]
MRILAMNSGSSSLKFGLYEMGPAEDRLLSGSVSGIGLATSVFRAKDGKGRLLADRSVTVTDSRDAVNTLLVWLEEGNSRRGLDAVGYRMVHGGPRYREPCRATPELMQELEALSPIDPEHLPAAVAVVNACRRAYPDVEHVLCFDTAFHRTLPSVAQTIALPQSLRDEGILRYGFHGLSYEFVCEQLGSDASGARIIIAHLGNGASMAAVKDGRSIETTMGFSPTGGLVMSTRSGDLDPAVVLYLLRHKGMSPDQINEMVNRQSGLLGVSGLSSDMQQLLEKAHESSHAALAVELFCYQARKSVGALSAVLGGLDRLLFTGGIGENAPPIRERICSDLGFLGIHLDAERNSAGVAVISADDSAVTVQVVKTNEELMIARHTFRLVG